MPMLEIGWIAALLIAGCFGCVRIGEFLTALFFHNSEYDEAMSARNRWIKTVDKPRAAFVLTLMALLVIGLLVSYGTYKSLS